MRVAYVRGDGSDPAVQNALAALESAGCDRVVFDSTPPTRSESKAALISFIARMKAGDTLVVTSLDQIASTVPRLLERVADLVARGITVKTLSGELDTADPAVAHNIQALWSFEARLRNGKGSLGLHADRGIGRPRMLASSDVGRAREMIAKQGRSVADVAREMGVSRATLYRSLKRAEP